MNAKSDVEMRRAVAKGWLCMHLLCSIYALSLVPGFNSLLILAIIAGAVVMFLIESSTGRKAFAASIALFFACGIALRKLAYEEHGPTGTVFLLSIVVVLTAACIGYFVFGAEKQFSSDKEKSN